MSTSALKPGTHPWVGPAAQRQRASPCQLGLGAAIPESPRLPLRLLAAHAFPCYHAHPVAVEGLCRQHPQGHRLVARSNEAVLRWGRDPLPPALLDRGISNQIPEPGCVGRLLASTVSSGVVAR